MSPSKRKPELEKQIGVLQEELREIKEAEKKIEQQTMVGRCFVYTNSFGTDSSWPLYRKAVQIGDEFFTIGAEFMDNNTVLIRLEPNWGRADFGEPVSDDTYNLGVTHCMDAAMKILAGRKP